MRYSPCWRGGLAVLIVLLGFMAPALAAQADDSQPDSYAPGEVLVKLTSSMYLRAIASTYHLRLPKNGAAQLDRQPIYRLEIADGASPRDKADKLQRDRRILYAEPNYIGSLPEARQRSSWAVGGDAGDYSVQWAPAALRLSEAHEKSRGANIIVATLDTGVDPTIRRWSIILYPATTL